MAKKISFLLLSYWVNCPIILIYSDRNVTGRGILRNSRLKVESLIMAGFHEGVFIC